MSDTHIESPVAVITGAGRGMGAAIAKELNKRGYRLALMSPSDTAKTLAQGWRSEATILLSRRGLPRHHRVD